MSNVTNIMITGLFNENESELVKNHLKKFTKEMPEFMILDGSEVGGTKCLEADVFIGAFNYIDCELFCSTINGFRDFLEDFVFEDTQIIIRNQSDDIWHAHRASELTTNCFNAL